MNLAGVYNRGMKEGCWIFWYCNGKLKYQGNYLNNFEHSRWVMFERDGEPVYEITWRFGKSIGQRKWIGCGSEEQF